MQHKYCSVKQWFIEIISNRYGGGDYGETAVWNYKFTLKGFNEDYSEFLIEELSFEKVIKNNNLENILKNKINIALQICNDLTDFEVFEPKEITFCDFQKNCSVLKLIESAGQLKFRTINEKKNHQIHYLSENYTGEIAKQYKEYFKAHFDSSDIIGTDLKISSIRQYENSSYKLLIFHLGTGQEPEEVETGKLRKKEYKFDREFKTIEDVIFIEPILHHGAGFDYFKMDKK